MGRRPDIAALILKSGVLRPMTELSDIIQLPASDEEKELQVALLERGGFSEEELETALVVVPDLFDPAPFFVGRQLPTDSRSRRLDLLAIDPEHGFLKVYELKKGPIQRIAIAQVLDYMLWVCETKTEDLAWQIITHGREDNGIGRFWKPEKIREFVGHARRAGNVAFPVVIGTDYRPQVARLANHADVQLFTVQQLCASWRSRHEHQS